MASLSMAIAQGFNSHLKRMEIAVSAYPFWHPDRIPQNNTTGIKCIWSFFFA